jgi:N-acetylglucosamine kinase-like BadF-type ATPase
MILGVDGGNTKTIALLAAPDGMVLGAGRSGCGDIYGAPTAEAAVGEIASAVNAALKQANVAREQIDCACFSLAGADWPEDYAYLQSALERAGFGRELRVYNDAIGALRAGSPDGTGVVIACGTGTAVAARNADGLFWHSSFWQEAACGLQLGKQMLRAVYRSELGLEPPTTLTQAALHFFKQPSVEALLHYFTGREHDTSATSPMSQLAPYLLTEAENGDAIARRIVEENAARLAEYALVAARKVGIDHSPYTVLLNGGVFRHPGTLMPDMIRERLQQVSPGVTLVRSRHEPATGALLLAFELAGIFVTPDLMNRLESSLPPAAFFSTA